MKPMTLVVCAGLVMTTAGLARGQTINWASPVSGSWSTAENWNPNNVPDNASENASLAFTTPYVVTIPGVSYSIAGYTASNPQAELQLQPGGASYTVLSLQGPILNNGLLRLPFSASANKARLQINTHGLAFDGSGELRMEDPNDAELYFNVGSGGVFVNGPGHRITGAGVIFGAGCALANEGTIVGNLAGGLVVNNNVENKSTVRATGAGSVVLGGVIVNQTAPGVLEADGATLTLSGTSVNGGKVRSVNGGVVTLSASGATLAGVTTEGELQIAPTVAGYTVMGMHGDVTNNGLIRLPAAASANKTRVQVNVNGVALRGAGELRMEETADTELYINVGGGGVFTNGATHRITGSGAILGAGCSLTNEGTVLADRAGGLNISNNVENKGFMRAAGAGAMTIANCTINQSGSGIIEADGATITLDAASLNGNSIRTVNGGVIAVGPAGASIGGLTVTGELQIPATVAGITALRMHNHVVNNGLIRMPSSPSANHSRLQVNVNGLVLGGSGQLRMEEAADHELYINIGGGGLFVNAAPHTIAGTGAIVGAGCSLTNEGVVLADRAGGLNVNNNVENKGVMRATGPGVLTFSGHIMNQSGAGVTVADGSRVVLDGVSINGNPVRSINGGVVAVGPAGASISGVTAEGAWEIPVTTSGITALGMHGNATNNAIIRMPASPSANSARFQINVNGVTLSGSGEIRMEESGDTAFFINVGGGGVFTNGPGHKISGLGGITGAGCTLTNAGILAPGAPLGTLRLANTAVLTPASVVEIELGGDAASQRDYLDASGSSVALGGTLKVAFRDGYVLPACSSVVVVRGNLSGVFETHDLPVMPQGEISVSYGTNTVTIGYIPGDLNGDGILDFSDYLQFLNLYDAADIRADLNQDEIVDFSDYLEFLNLYDARC